MTHDDLPPDALTAKIRALVAADLEPIAPRSARTRALLLAGGVALGVTLAAIAFGRAVGAPMQHRTETLVALAFAVAGALSVARAMPGTVPRSNAELAPLVVGVGWLAYLAFLSRSPGEHDAPSFVCLAISGAGGLVSIAVAHWAWRFTDPWNPRRTGALIGLVAGCVGAAGVSVACTSHDLLHLLTGHGLTMLLLAPLSAALAMRTLRP
jgi:hypothetical protein